MGSHKYIEKLLPIKSSKVQYSAAAAETKRQGKEKSMKIMVIDDKYQELEKAEKAVKDAGHECIAINPELAFLKILEKMSEVDGIITDLMFCPSNIVGNYPTEIPPGGLLVIIHAISLSKPVVVCTNCYESEQDGHHGKTISWIHDSYIGPLLYELKLGLPFDWLEEGSGWQEEVKKRGKNWPKAVEALLQRIK